MENIVVLCGGRSAEHEISIISARAVAKGLIEAGYSVQILGINKQGRSFNAAETSVMLEMPEGNRLQYPECSNWIAWLSLIKDSSPVVFPVLHGPYGEDGTVQGLLELLDLPYVGAGVCGSAVAMNKIHTKEILKSYGLPVLPWISISRKEAAEGFDPSRLLDEKFGYPVFVKPANMGSSVGISKAADPIALNKAVTKAFRYDEHVLIEKGIEAREIELSVLGFHPPRVSIPGEIIPGDEFYSYEAKYLSEESRLIIPAPLEDHQKERLNVLAGAVFSYLQLEGMARIDFLVERANGDIWINEPNTIPGFTRISMYPKLWAAGGMAFPELMRALIKLALQRWEKRRLIEVDR